MPEYIVHVDRTSVRVVKLVVKANNEFEAEVEALKIAGNYNFNDSTECGVQYEVAFVEETN